MKVRPLNAKQSARLVTWGIEKAYAKSVKLFENNTLHPSLRYKVMRGTEYLNPVMRSFRINDKYRVEGYEMGDEFHPVRVSNHYN